MANYDISDLVVSDSPTTYDISELDPSVESKPQKKKDFVQKLAEKGAEFLQPSVPPAYQGGYLNPSVVSEQGLGSLLSPTSLGGSMQATAGAAIPAIAQNYLSKLSEAPGILDKLSVSPVSLPRAGEQQGWKQYPAALYNAAADLGEGALSPFGLGVLRAVNPSSLFSAEKLAANPATARLASQIGNIARPLLGGYFGLEGLVGGHRALTTEGLTPQQRIQGLASSAAGILGGGALGLSRLKVPSLPEEVKPPPLPEVVKASEAPKNYDIRDLLDEQFPTQTKGGEVVGKYSDYPGENIAANLTDPNYEIQRKLLSGPNFMLPEQSLSTYNNTIDNLFGEEEAARNESLKPKALEQERIAELQAIEDAKKVNEPVKKETVSENPVLFASKTASEPESTKPVEPLIKPVEYPPEESTEIPTSLQAAEARIKDGLSKGITIKYGDLRQGGFINPSIFSDIIDYGNHVYTKLKDFTSWSAELVKRFGETITPYLKGAWNNITGEDSHTPIIGSMVDKLRNTGEPSHVTFANAADYASNLRRNNAKWENDFARALQPLSNDQVRFLNDLLYKEDQTHTSLRNTVPPEILPSYDAARKAYLAPRIDQIINKQPVYENGIPRQAKADPTAWFNVMSRKVRDILNKTPESPEAISLKNDFIRHQLDTGKAETLEEAQKTMADFLSATAETSRNPEQFRALRTQAGVGLPKSWIEPDLREAGRRYFQRAAADRAFFDAFEKNHDTLKVIGEKVDPWDNPVQSKLNPILGDPAVDSMLKQFRGQVGSYSPTTNAVSALGTNLFLANPLTGLKDIYSNITGSLKFAPTYADIFKNIAEFSPDNLAKSYERSLSTGFNRVNPNAINEIVLSNSIAADGLNKISRLLQTYSGRYPLELLSRTIGQFTGENYARSYLNLAHLSNDPHAIKFIQKLFPEKPWQEVTHNDITEFGTRIGQLMQGRYDATELPKFALDNPIAPILKISRWNIGQANNFVKYVINPAREGNIRPLLLSTVGPLLAPVTIRKLVEIFNNRKDTVPGYTQIFDNIKSGDFKDYTNDEKLLVYRLMADADMAGTGGIFASLGRTIFDAAYKNRAMTVNAPLYSVIKDSGVNTTQALSAIISGENPTEVLPKLVANLVTGNLRLASLALRQYGRLLPESKIGKEQISAAEKDELRQWQQLNGLAFSDRTSSDTANPYTEIESKKFKQATTPEDITSSLLSVVDKNKENPLVLGQKLRGLKESTHGAMPSDELQKGMYYQYLVRLYGQDKANTILRHSLEKEYMDKAKNELVPSIR